LDRTNRSTTIEPDFQSNRNLFAVIRRHRSPITEGLDGKPEKILSEVEKMTQLLKPPNKKCPSDQRVFIEMPVE
jgi:hypothetical protein